MMISIRLVAPVHDTGTKPSGPKSFHVHIAFTLYKIEFICTESVDSTNKPLYWCLLRCLNNKEMRVLVSVSPNSLF
ncbi:hypothetical protein HanIR_Chr15g0769291 [Helianthus annuus]|nr:hypothetical protein HanIR_Chr15g0769291 [Helianthus annuus]